MLTRSKSLILPQQYTQVVPKLPAKHVRYRVHRAHNLELYTEKRFVCFQKPRFVAHLKHSSKNGKLSVHIFTSRILQRTYRGPNRTTNSKTLRFFYLNSFHVCVCVCYFAHGTHYIIIVDRHSIVAFLTFSACLHVFQKVHRIYFGYILAGKFSYGYNVRNLYFHVLACYSISGELVRIFY